MARPRPSLEPISINLNLNQKPYKDADETKEESVSTRALLLRVQANKRYSRQKSRIETAENTKSK